MSFQRLRRFSNLIVALFKIDAITTKYSTFTITGSTILYPLPLAEQLKGLKLNNSKATKMTQNLKQSTLFKVKDFIRNQQKGKTKKDNFKDFTGEEW